MNPMTTFTDAYNEAFDRQLRRHRDLAALAGRRGESAPSFNRRRAKAEAAAEACEVAAFRHELDEAEIAGLPARRDRLLESAGLVPTRLNPGPKI